MGEAVIISFVAFLISLVVLHLAENSFIASLVDADMSLGVQWKIIGVTGIIALLVGALAGGYPACYITSFPPALVLKGSFGLSPKGRVLRSTLVSIQFIASFILIIGSLFMFLQNHYMQSAPLGYDKDELIVVELNSKINKNLSVLESEIKTFSGIEAITCADQILSSRDYYMGWGRNYNDKPFCAVGSGCILWRISLVGELCLPYSDLLVGISGSLCYCFGHYFYNRYLPELAGSKFESGGKYKVGVIRL